MSQNTKIEWADHTFNPWVGCTKISPACDHCYAEGWAKRSGQVVWSADRKRTSFANWRLPIKWNKHAEIEQNAWQIGVDLYGGDEAACIAAGYIKPVRPKVFCASLADVFDNEVPQLWRTSLFGLIYDTPHLDWLLLTKRIGNAARMLKGDPPEGIDMAAMPNVWIGATICNQEEADRDLPKLERVPAAQRFVSIEPLLGPIDLGLMQYHDSDHTDEQGRIIANTRRRWLRWVIVGGESGANARPMHPAWVRSLRDQCQAAGVPFLFKQWGEWWEYVNEDHYTHCGAEKHAHAWVDADTGDSGKCWIVDDDGSWSNWTGTPRGLPKGDEDVNGGNMHPSVTVMGRHGKKAAGRLLDGREWNEVPS